MSQSGNTKHPHLGIMTTAAHRKIRFKEIIYRKDSAAIMFTFVFIIIRLIWRTNMTGV